METSSIIIYEKNEERKSLDTLIYTEKTELERNQVVPFEICITRIELFGLNERVIEEAR